MWAELNLQIDTLPSLPARVKAVIAANGGHSRFLRARSVKVIGMDYSIFYFFPTHWRPPAVTLILQLS